MAYNLSAGAQGAVAGISAGAKLGGWGAIAGGALGALSGFGEKDKSSRKMAEAMALQNYYWKQQMLTAHQLEAEDLAKAGFNPALTTNTGTAGAGIGSNSASYAPEFQDIAHTNKISSGLKMLEAVKEYKALEQNERKTQADIDNIEADTTGKILDNEIVKKYGSKQAKANYANTLMKIQELKGKIGLDMAMMGKIGEEGNALARENQYWKEHPNLYSYNTGWRAPIQDTFKAVAGVAGLATGAVKANQIARAIENSGKTRTTEFFNPSGKFIGAKRSFYE